MKKIIATIFISGGLLAGCSLFGDSKPSDEYNQAYPNNGAYGPDANTYIPDASDASVEQEAAAEVAEASAPVVDASPPSTCLISCAALECGTVPDQCGGYITCTPCRDTEECVNNFCRQKTPTCTPETDNSFCTRYAMACGAHTGLDNCGAVRTVINCGACLTGVCSNNACCNPETDAQLCTALKVECGIIPTTTDNCGTVRLTVACPLCTSPATCNATTNKCETIPVPPI